MIYTSVFISHSSHLLKAIKDSQRYWVLYSDHKVVFKRNKKREDETKEEQEGKREREGGKGRRKK